MRRFSSAKVAKWAFVVGLASAVSAGASQASGGEFVVENNSNETVLVAVGHTLPGNRARDEGWFVIPPGHRQVVYRGDNVQVAIHMQSGPNRQEIRPPKFFGTVNRYTSYEQFIREDTDVPGNIKLASGPNLERVFFKDQNDNLPPGWFNSTYYIVNANELFTVIP
jgi:uncharacterized membrane protein